MSVLPSMSLPVTVVGVTTVNVPLAIGPNGAEEALAEANPGLLAVTDKEMVVSSLRTEGM